MPRRRGGRALPQQRNPHVDTILFFLRTPQSAFRNSSSFPRYCNFAGAHYLLDADGSQKLNDSRDLLLISCYLERVALLRRINNARTEDVGDPERLCPVLGGGIDLD